MDQILEKLRPNRLQRLLLFGSAAVWFLYMVLSKQRNDQDGWILDGILLPFMGFIVVFLIVLWMENDNQWVAILCSLAVIVILLVPGLKYKQVYGEAIDGVVHYRMIHDLITTGKPSSNIYQAIAGMHSWLASMGITGGLSASTIVKIGFPLSGGMIPLLVYWVCRRIHMAVDLSKYIISLSCLAMYPFHSITGTGFTLVPLLLFLSVLLLREYYCNTTSERIIYTLIALLVLVQLTIWHSTTPLILLLLLVSVSLTPVLIWLITGRKKRTRINARFLQFGFLALILILGYHTIEIDPVFKVVFSRLYQLVIAENTATYIIPANLFKLTLIEALRVYLVMYGRDALMVILAVLGLFIIWRQRSHFEPFLPAYAFWSLIILTFIISIPLNFVGVDFRRLIWIPLAISPFFAGPVLQWCHQKGLSQKRYAQWIGHVVGFLLTFIAVGVFVIEFFIYQPLIPKSKSLSPDTPDEYSVWLVQVNSAFQQRMITFAETNANPTTRFNIDVLGYRQFIRYYGSTKGRGLYTTLAANSKTTAPRTDEGNRLFLLHLPGKAGGFAEQVQYRSSKYLTQLRDTVGWELIYDNGESFILQIP
jgi:lipid-A-disaccharide synthase-like uncharacterized protein